MVLNNARWKRTKDPCGEIKKQVGQSDGWPPVKMMAVG